MEHCSIPLSVNFILYLNIFSKTGRPIISIFEKLDPYCRKRERSMNLYRLNIMVSVWAD